MFTKDEVDRVTKEVAVQASEQVRKQDQAYWHHVLNCVAKEIWSTLADHAAKESVKGLSEIVTEISTGQTWWSENAGRSTNESSDFIDGRRRGLNEAADHLTRWRMRVEQEINDRIANNKT